MGESAGGGSTIHQITAYGGLLGKVPFQQAIVQSGAFLMVPYNNRPEDIFQKFLTLAGVSTLQTARGLSTQKLQLVNYQLVGEAPFGDFTFSKCTLTLREMFLLIICFRSCRRRVLLPRPPRSPSRPRPVRQIPQTSNRPQRRRRSLLHLPFRFHRAHLPQKRHRSILPRLAYRRSRRLHRQHALSSRVRRHLRIHRSHRPRHLHRLTSAVSMQCRVSCSGVQELRLCLFVQCPAISTRRRCTVHVL